MIYYSLQNKKTKKLIKIYSTIFYANVCYNLSAVGSRVWLVSKDVAKKALETPNLSSKDEAEYDNPCNGLEKSEWKVVEVTLNIKDPA